MYPADTSARALWTGAQQPQLIATDHAGELRYHNLEYLPPRLRVGKNFQVRGRVGLR